MEVNFNNLRKQACFAYDRLANKLNNCILSEYEYGDKKSNGKSISGNMLVDVEDIQEAMEGLRRLIGSIAMCYNEDDPDMKDVFEEIYPDDKNMIYFNSENE